MIIRRQIAKNKKMEEIKRLYPKSQSITMKENRSKKMIQENSKEEIDEFSYYPDDDLSEHREVKQDKGNKNKKISTRKKEKTEPMI
jgi:hypothetical protein